MRVKMPSISCFSYRFSNKIPYNFIFIKFEKFVKIIFHFSKSVILQNEVLASNKELFQIFSLSLLLTDDTSIVSCVNDKNKIKYGVETLRYWNKPRIANYYGFVQLDKSSYKNPLNMMEPKRQSGDKKIRKFFKLFNFFIKKEIVKDPLIIIDEFITREGYEAIQYIEKYIEYECRINILSNILHKYGRDVYDSVNKFM